MSSIQSVSPKVVPQSSAGALSQPKAGAKAAADHFEKAAPVRGFLQAGLDPVRQGVSGRDVAAALGVSEERQREIDQRVREVEGGLYGGMVSVAETTGDLNDAEYQYFVWSLTQETAASGQFNQALQYFGGDPRFGTAFNHAYEQGWIDRSTLSNALDWLANTSDPLNQAADPGAVLGILLPAAGDALKADLATVLVDQLAQMPLGDAAFDGSRTNYANALADLASASPAATLAAARELVQQPGAQVALVAFGDAEKVAGLAEGIAALGGDPASALTSSEASSFRRLREFLEARDGGESLRSEIAARREAMGPAWNGAGLAMPEDTGVYDATSALPTLLNPTNRATVERLAAEYGIDPALLAGVVAAEMDFDHSTKDALHDGVARNFPWILDLTGLSRGVGIASVHQNQLSDAIAYINAHPDHFSPDVVAAANDFDSSTGNLASFEGSVEAAAIVTAVLVDVKRQNGGTVDTAQDMAVIWGAFRSGIGGFSSNEQGSGTLAVGQGGYANVDDFAHNRANGADALPTEMQIGGNAYQSEPYFEYLQGVFGP